ncbi:MAG: hypothetical protein QG641_2743, partial [Candidatus Poribacteria bacterium]|nr:hypothetical protein [Candidatus Poribacteria bacterium]
MSLTNSCIISTLKILLTVLKIGIEKANVDSVFNSQPYDYHLLKKLFIILLLITGLLASGLGLIANAMSEESVEVRSSGKMLYEAAPRQIVTATFQVKNIAKERIQFDSEVKLPEGWKLITSEFPFELNADESDTRLVSFFIPQKTLAGRYEITYLVRNRKNLSANGFETISVVILPLFKLEARVLETPEWTIAGKDYQVSFLVASWTNSTSKIVVEAESENKWPVVIDQEKFQLNPSESRIVKVTVKTEANLRKKTKHYLKLKAKASVLNNGKAEASAENWVEIIPRVSAGDERFHKIPMEFKIRGVTEQNGERKQGLQTMLSSMGTLDEDGEKHVDLLLVWSDLSDKSVFGGHDEFHLSYWTDRYEVRLGDQFTFLSPLTEYYSYGRGAEGKVEFGNLTIGALKKKAQWIKAENSKTAAYISYLLDKKYKFGFNFVDHQPSDNRIFSFRSQLNPYKPVYVDLEAASGDENGKRDSAYFVNVTNTQKWLLANLKLVHAGPYYIGYYRDTDLKSTDITLTVWKFKLSGDFYSQKQNLQLNPAYYSAPFKRSYQSELSSTFLNTRLSVGYKDSLRRDLLPKSSFNYREKTLRIELSQSFPKLSLWLAGEKGNIENLFDEKTYDLRRYWFSAFYQPFRWQNISSYAEVEDESTRKTMVGVSTCSQIAEQTLFRITLNIGWQDNTRIFDIADIALEHRFSNDWHILFEGRRSSYRDWRPELDTTIIVLFEFGIPFRLPTIKNNNVGRLKGVIYDIESKASQCS